ncbi:flavodoxin domain-containing protein [Corynebacterium uterequi]|uniref:Flavodoxin domain n=1 Tax=Corynebacterium uterequi TaxID=1072256 RepID=A0A0G3HFP8_9CORY|nr:flavodoxin domain-containing protein [Corynebacterium uterequi]AKK10773.1 Flavodoxin domain [Corynebacterium uterequi]
MTHILYASAYGSSRMYAEELARRLNTTAVAMTEVAPEDLAGSDPVITVSYTHGPSLPAASFFTQHHLPQRPLAACAVGMSLVSAARERDQMKSMLGEQAANVERFYLPGRLAYSEISPAHRKVMFGVVNALKLKPRKSDNDRNLIQDYGQDVDRIDFAELDPVVAWARAHGA